MRKVQDAHGIGTMLISKLLQPFRPIRYEAHLACRLHPAPLGFDQRQALKRVGVGQA
jgi:hypothetical protein